MPTYPAVSNDQAHNLVDEEVRSGNSDTMAEGVRKVLHAIIESKSSATSANPTLDVAINSIEKTDDNKFQLEGDLDKYVHAKMGFLESTIFPCLRLSRFKHTSSGRLFDKNEFLAFARRLIAGNPSCLKLNTGVHLLRYCKV